MAGSTKWYVLNEPAPYTPPSWQGGWDLGAGGTDRAFDPVKFGGVASSAVRAEAVTTNPYRVGILRLVSRRLKNTQTISGTVNVMLGLSESNASANFFTRLHIYLVKQSDGSVQGTLLNQYEESSGGGGTEWPTTNTGTALQGAQALTSQAVPSAGDYRLVVEVGYRAENGDVTSYTGTIRTGARSALREPLADLTLGSTSTSTLAGYIEFVNGVELAADVLGNLNPETALVLGPTLPDSDAMELHDAGYTYTRWAKWQAPASGIQTATIFAFGGLGTFEPSTTVYDGVGAGTASVAFATNKAIQFPVKASAAHYVAFVPNSGNPSPASLTIDLQKAPDYDAAAGAIVVPDDTFSRAALISPTVDFQVIQFRALPPGEAGDVLPSGVLCVEDTVEDDVDVYSAAFALLGEVAINTQTLAGSIRANPALDRFFAGSTGNPIEVKKIKPDGTVETTYTLTGQSGLRALAASNDGNTLYWSKQSGDTAAIRRWDLPGATALSDLVNLGTTTNIWDLIVLADGTILALFVNAFTPTVIVRRYNSSGSLLNTFDFSAEAQTFPAGTVPRIARAIDNPASFWIWTHHTGGISRFRNIRISDGATLGSVDHQEYELGEYQGAETAEPTSFFGVSFSCPFFVMPVAVPGSGGVAPPALGLIGPYVWVHWPRVIPFDISGVVAQTLGAATLSATGTVV